MKFITNVLIFKITFAANFIGTNSIIIHQCYHRDGQKKSQRNPGKSETISSKTEYLANNYTINCWQSIENVN